MSADRGESSQSEGSEENLCGGGGERQSNTVVDQEMIKCLGILKHDLLL